MKLLSYISIAVLGLFSLTMKGQDVHFSQFESAPYNLNPAYCADFDGAYRIIGNQRSQWRSVTTPYSTFAIGADAPWKNHGLGFSFIHDKAGDSRLTSTYFNLLFSHPMKLSNAKNVTFIPAVSLGITNMSIDYSQLRYDSQWTGIIYDPNQSSGEQFARDSRAYLNLHIGARAIKKWEGGKELSMGFSFYNLSAPKQSFFDDGYVKLDLRTNVHANYRFYLKENIILAPSMLVMAQGTYREWDLGGTGEYVLESKEWMYRSVFGGIYYRTKDAGFLVAGMRYDQWKVGLSYDINTSNLRPASNGRGGLEVSVIYIAPPKVKALPARKVCRDFI